MYKFLSLWFLVFFLSLNLTFAQPKVVLPVLTLADAEALALQNNYGIILRKIGAEAAKANVTRGNAGQLPTVTIGVAQTYSNNTVSQDFSNPASASINRTGAGTTVTTGNVSLTWPIFDGFEMFVQYDRLKLVRDMGQVQAKATIEFTLASTRTAYYNLVLQEKKILLLRANLALSQERIEVAENRFAAGIGSKLEVLNAQVDFNADQSALNQQEEVAAHASADLNLLLSRPVEMQFISQGELIPTDSILEQPLTNQLLATNNALKLARYNQEMAWQNIKLANSLKYPQINFAAGFNYSDQSFQAGLFKRNLSYGPTLGLNGSMTLFNGGQVQSAIKQSQYASEQAAISLKQVENEQQASLYNVLLTYKTNRKLVALEGSSLKIAKLNAEVALDRYKVGLARPIELREAQRNSLASETRLLEAQYRICQAEIEIKRIVGTN